MSSEQSGLDGEASAGSIREGPQLAEPQQNTNNINQYGMPEEQQTQNRQQQ